MTATPDLYMVVIKDTEGTLEYEVDAQDPLTALRRTIRTAVREGWHAEDHLTFNVEVKVVHRNNKPERKWWRP